MATGLTPTTVAKAGPIMAEAMNLQWPQDRREVVKHINRFRLLLYTEYDKAKLFDDVFYRIAVSQFSGYLGFTLPSDVQGVEAVWHDGLPLSVHTRWRETHVGRNINKSGSVRTLLMAEQFCTERDLNAITKIKVFADSIDDTGKCVHIDVLDATGRKRRLRFILTGDGYTVSPCKVSQILNVALPTDLLGGIRLSQQDGFDLSEYAPWQTAPSYQRMKILGTCPDPCVWFQGTRRFQDVWFDHDIVEVGNQLIIEEAGKFFKYGDNTTDMAEIKTARYHKELMDGYLRGEKSRQEGNAKQDGSAFRGNPRTGSIRKPLPGYLRR